MAELNNAIAQQASVTAIWEAAATLRQIGRQIDDLELRLDSAGHAADYVGSAAFSMLPAVLALPARSDEEAMMQLCALAELVTVRADSENGELNEDINLWRAALVSILNAMSGDECLSRCLSGTEMEEFLGRGALNGLRKRLASIMEAPKAMAAE